MEKEKITNKKVEILMISWVGNNKFIQERIFRTLGVDSGILFLGLGGDYIAVHFTII